MLPETTKEQHKAHVREQLASLLEQLAPQVRDDAFEYYDVEQYTTPDGSRVYAIRLQTPAPDQTLAV